ncbi:hypothetical protein Clacol_003843 [Clathrus columnatus]|uniref:WD40 repeat-like protein n=1 Tax=Clathrus columnatus TaxID=1419009 RepID=A0AAV5A9L4_9AGAM|nr:hypothetical protein Clacol_003843 [Clathrus columnatus]
MDYLDDEDAFNGPDAYVDEFDEFDVEYQIAEDDNDADYAEDDEEDDEDEEEEDDGLNAQRQSIVDLLNNAFVSIVPDSQGAESTTGETLTSGLTLDQVRLLLAAAQSRQLQMADEDEEDEEEDDDDDSMHYTSGAFGHRRPHSSKAWFKPFTEAQEAGVQLLYSGEFGRLSAKKSDNIRRMLKGRESRIPHHGQGLYKEDFGRKFVPNSDGTVVASYGSNAYSGQYSADWRLYVYDTKAPLNPISRDSDRGRRFGEDNDHETTMKTIKTVQAVPGSWTITDTSTVYLTKTHEPSAPQIPLKFGSAGGRNRMRDYDGDDFGIYSCRFSADGNEVIAGGNGRNGGELRVYDLLTDRKTITIDAHDNDVNSCCWADSASGNVLVRDRRSLGSTQKPSGVLVGHTEGITYVSAKGDGRYIISNGKDQAMRLWDLRKMRSNEEFETFSGKYYGHRSFDYRYGSYPKPKVAHHPKDCSVMVYRGHQVFRTLIRCHFSPIETTGANYIYTGSSDGRIHVYSLDGRVVQVLDRRTTLPISFDPSEPVPGEKLPGQAPVCVRDVNWHSQEPVIMSVGWESGYGRSSVARHEWKGIGKLGDSMGKLEDFVEKGVLESSERRYQTRSSQMPGSYDSEDDDQ